MKNHPIAYYLGLIAGSGAVIVLSLIGMPFIVNLVICFAIFAAGFLLSTKINK